MVPTMWLQFSVQKYLVSSDPAVRLTQRKGRKPNPTFYKNKHRVRNVENCLYILISCLEKAGMLRNVSDTHTAACATAASLKISEAVVRKDFLAVTVDK